MFLMENSVDLKVSFSKLNPTQKGNFKVKTMFQKNLIKIAFSICVVSLATACAFKTTQQPLKVQSATHSTRFSIQKMNLSAHEAVIATGDNHLLHVQFEGELQNDELVVKSVHPVKVTDLNGESASDYALDREDYERVVSVLEGV